MIQTFTRQDLKEVLMDPKLPGVREPYFIIHGEDGQELIIVSPGKNGEEFNKTYGHFNFYPEVEIYHVAFGQGVLVLQRNDEAGEAKEVRVTPLRPGTVAEVPSGYGQTIVNIGKAYLVVTDGFTKIRSHHDIEPVRQKHGFAYYLVDKKGEVGFEPNSNYRLHPQISMG